MFVLGGKAKFPRIPQFPRFPRNRLDRPFTILHLHPKQTVIACSRHSHLQCVETAGM